jgi:Flp pilus assembly protein TadD
LALEADPANAAAHDGLVRANLAAGDTLTARLVLARWSDLGADTSATLLFSRALLWEKTGDWEEARRTCESVLALDSAKVDGWLLLARLLQRAGSDATAVSVLKQATLHLDKESRLWKALGQSALRAGEPEVAELALVRAWKLGDKSARDLLRQVASWHEVRGETASAQRVRGLLADSLPTP